MSSLTATSEVEAYLSAVRRELEDLSEEERGDLLEDLASHLVEIAVDAGDEEPVGLVARLGAPGQYAAELRAAAGLRARDDARSSPSSAGTGLLGALARSQFSRRAQAVWRHPTAHETRRFLRELTPAWWLLRGYLVVALPAWGAADGVDDFPIPTVADSTAIGAVAVAVAVAASVALGRRRQGPAGKVLTFAADVVIAMVALVTLMNLDGRLVQTRVVYIPQVSTAALSSRDGPVTNILPYSRDGQPLADVLLFDQDGRPLRATFQEWWPDGCRRFVDHPRAADGVPVEFAYPLRYAVAPGAQAGACGSAFRPAVPLPAFTPGG